MFKWSKLHIFSVEAKMKLLSLSHAEILLSLKKKIHNFEFSNKYYSNSNKIEYKKNQFLSSFDICLKLEYLYFVKCCFQFHNFYSNWSNGQWKFQYNSSKHRLKMYLWICGQKLLHQHWWHFFLSSFFEKWENSFLASVVFSPFRPSFCFLAWNTLSGEHQNFHKFYIFSFFVPTFIRKCMVFEKFQVTIS